jgi:hypothetical protein
MSLSKGLKRFYFLTQKERNWLMFLCRSKEEHRQIINLVIKLVYLSGNI